MYAPAPVSSAVDTVTAALAAQADVGRLTIYAGAGLSAAPPTSLPGSAALAERIVARLTGRVDFSGIDSRDLVAVADQVEKQPSGRKLLEQALLRCADFEQARPNYGHQVVALLLCEGVATVFETNYDMCVELSAQPERPRVVIRDADLLEGSTTALLKAHGCASTPSSMVITSADLKKAPLWARANVSARLSHDTVLFVGIGSVADYVQSSIHAVMAAVGHGNLLLVDPALAAWDTDPDLDWRKLLGTLPAAQRDARGASEFLDAVLRAYVQDGLEHVRDLIAGFDPGYRQRVGTEAVLAELTAKDAVAAVRWLRYATWRLTAGLRVVGAPTMTDGLLALGGLTGADYTLSVLEEGWVRAVRPADPATGRPALDQAVLLLLVNGANDGTATAREARERVAEAKRRGYVGLQEDVVVVVVRCIGPLGLEEISVTSGDGLDVVLTGAASAFGGLPTDLLTDTAGDHLIDAGSGGGIFFVKGELVVETCTV